MNYLPTINPQKEVEKIVSFLKQTFVNQKIEKVVIGVSGGIDSTVSLFLLSRTLQKQNIIPVHLPFFNEDFALQKALIKNTGIPEKNFQTIFIKSIVEHEAETLGVSLKSTNTENKIRLGNLMARTRMIILYDLAKRNKALVCGTENKSEKLLGYFTRHGDQASDIEPISHLYKTQVRELAKYLQVAKEIIEQPPSAGLWPDQTDEGQLGFSYEEADQVLYLYFEKKNPLSKIISLGFANARKIIDHVNANSFKHNLPYHL